MAKGRSRFNAGGSAPPPARRLGLRRKPASDDKPAPSPKGSSQRKAAGQKDQPGIRKRPIKEPPAPDVDLPALPQQSKVPRLTNEGFSLDRKLDLLGVVLVVLAIIAFLGYVSEAGAVTGALLRLLGQLFGWYAPLLIALVGYIGIWLILRNFRERPARLQIFRIAGFVMLGVTALTATHFAGMNFSPGVDARDFEAAFAHAERGAGGGYIGAYLYSTLAQAIGMVGTAIVLLGALIASAMLTFGVTFGDIADFFRALNARLRGLSLARGGDVMVQTPLVVSAADALETGAPAAGVTPPALPAAEGAPAPPVGAPPDAAPTSDAPADALDGPPSLVVTAGEEGTLPEYKTILNEGSEGGVSDKVLLEQARIIEDTLRSFGAPGRVVEVNPGPVVTQFGVEPDYLDIRGGKKIKVKVNKIATLADDLALALAAKSVRVEAPVPGKGFVGIEVPNPETSLVSLRDVLDSPSFRRFVKSRLAFGLGQSVDGEPVSADLAAMPHLLIAGATGSGKSVLVNAIIACLLLRNTPDELRVIMVDPKRVELTGYNGVPHLVTPVVTDLERIVGVLKWVTREMDERYRKFAHTGVRNIAGYNRKVGKGGGQLPYLVVIIDELADLMMMAPEETERVVTRIAQMARATGIHLIIATQRPSVDVVTGLIKANFPARIAFAVASQVDSRVILDMPGAERLLGRGDMLFQSPDAASPVRLQGVFVSDEEISRLVAYWRKAAAQNGNAANALPAPGEAKPSDPLERPRSAPQRPQALALSPQPTPPRPISTPPAAPRPPATAPATAAPVPHPDELAQAGKDAIDKNHDGEDDLYADAVTVVREMGKASASLLQRRLRIGYNRASKLIEAMEARGVIGPAGDNPAAPREVLPARGESSESRVQNPEEPRRHE